MTDAQKNFVEIEKQRKKFLDDFDAALKAVAEEVQPGGFFQDEEKVVYKIVIPAGRWIKFDAVSYVRTKRGDESKGTLSAKEATEAGFEI